MGTPGDVHNCIITQSITDVTRQIIVHEYKFQLCFIESIHNIAIIMKKQSKRLAAIGGQYELLPQWYITIRIF